MCKETPIELCEVCGQYENDENPCACFICGYCSALSHDDTLIVSKDKEDENMYCSIKCAEREAVMMQGIANTTN